MNRRYCGHDNRLGQVAQICMLDASSMMYPRPHGDVGNLFPLRADYHAPPDCGLRLLYSG